MYGNWCLLASQTEAKIITKTSDKELKVVKEFRNPLGRTRNRELIRKQAGMGMKSIGRGTVKYSETKRHSPHEVAAEQFAKKVSNYLEEQFQKNNFKSLTVVAEPKFLGKLRAAMTPELRKLIIKSLAKDLQKTPKRQLGIFLLNSF